MWFVNNQRTFVVNFHQDFVAKMLRDFFQGQTDWAQTRRRFPLQICHQIYLVNIDCLKMEQNTLKLKQFFEYQHLLLLRDIWWLKF
jgi:hypothetical protein